MKIRQRQNASVLLNWTRTDAGNAMHMLTGRRQNVTVMTVNTLRSHLESFSRPDCKFSIDKVHRDRVSIRADYFLSGNRKHSCVLLPAYPTGFPGDAPCNNLNVVLDPLSFVDADTHAEYHVFLPLLGHEVLAHYEKLHPQEGLPISRCC